MQVPADLRHSFMLPEPGVVPGNEPRTITVSGGLFRIPAKGHIVLEKAENRDILPAARKLQRVSSQVLHLNLRLSAGTRLSLKSAYCFSYNPLLPAQAYEIAVGAEGIAVAYSSPEGAYYQSAR